MKPYTIICLDRVYKLRLTFSAITEYEQLTEKMLAAFDISNAEEMLCLLWVLVRQDQPSISLEETVKLVAEATDKTDLFKAVRGTIANSIKQTTNKTPGTPEFFDIESTLKIAAEIGMKPAELYDLTPARIVF